MKKMYDVAENQKNMLEIEQAHKNLIANVRYYLENIDKFVENLCDEEITELIEYFHFSVRRSRKEIVLDVDMKRMKAFILLFREFSDSYDVGKVLSFLESIEYGWRGDKYYLNNHCLRNRLYHPEGHCKKIHKTPDVETATEIFGNIYNLFFDKEYGEITLFIFSYCLAALFSGKLDQDHFQIPFYLQIACDRDSVLYQLIHEIVEICDINSGLFEHCNDSNHNYDYCGYTHQTHYPTQSTAKDINDLASNQDIPVIIDGHENDRYYNALLREVANIPHKRKPLDMSGRFNILPIFICPVIKSSFQNVFDMPLSDLDVSTEYLTLLRDNKRMLASWVLELVMSFSRYLFPYMNESSAQKKHPFSSYIGTYINHINRKYSDLTLKNTRNIGFLNFFFKGCLRVFQESFSFPLDEEFECFVRNNQPLRQSGEKNILLLAEQSEKSLVELHRRYLPTSKSIGIKNKPAIQLAKQIEKHYRALKVYIRVTPVVIQEDRYVFNVDTLQETKDEDIGKRAETVQRRLKKYECFKPDFSDPKTIKIVVAEKPLEDNSLIGILQHKDFTESKMKIPYAIGYDDMGRMCIKDIFEFPHLLLGGATLSGKSTAMKCLLMSIAYKHRTGNVRVLILDLLGKEESNFDVFNDQPILSHTIIKDVNTAFEVIMKLEGEREARNKKKNLSDMPYIVCVIDEFPRLFSDINDKKKSGMLEVAITRLLSGGRHSRIHLVLAAQDPSKKHMVCGIGNLRAKIALPVDHYQRSIAILGRAGAEKLLGKGRMIFDSPDERDKRLQGAYISAADAKKELDEIRRTFKQENKYPFVISEAKLELDPMESDEESHGSTKKSKSDDESLLAKIIIKLLGEDTFSSLSIETEFHIGYRRAVPIVGILEEFNLVSEKHANRQRKVIPERIEDLPPEVIELLLRNGCTEDDIKNAFSQRPVKATTQRNSL